MRFYLIAFAIVFSSAAFSGGFNAEMQKYIESLKQEAKAQNPNFKDFSAQNGAKIFSTKNAGKEGKVISCQSCHNEDLRTKAQNIFTGKEIAPLAPSVNAARLSEVEQVQKWLKRNFKDVFLREGSAEEKGDVLYYLISQ